MSQDQTDIHQEVGLEIPHAQLNPETLQRMIQEFVTRDGADWGDVGCSLEDKVEQVLQQLRSNKIKVVFDQRSQTANLVVSQEKL